MGSYTLIFSFHGRVGLGNLLGLDRRNARSFAATFPPLADNRFSRLGCCMRKIIDIDRRQFWRHSLIGTVGTVVGLKMSAVHAQDKVTKKQAG